ncbi:hypothetical protein [Methanoplanus endosymbiosus]|uniref:Uncharacterized protein n=1 Tax=Methanoplanus endosymbiosus TaxID=33865 RepID=A0A9E7PSG3_9EURY|nr:hypothetical protein [Methanoplanus endosymbiosus]UUX92872.1 hypothetical protein L6E24_01720 [Methanoplanus endosymbiosus]
MQGESVKGAIFTGKTLKYGLFNRPYPDSRRLLWGRQNEDFCLFTDSGGISFPDFYYFRSA